MKNVRTTPYSLLAILFLTSCLNDSNNGVSLESPRDIAYITTINDTECAATSSGYITHPLVYELQQDECYIVAYRVSASDSQGIYNADMMKNISGAPLPQTKIIEGTSGKITNNSIAVDDLTIPVYSASNYMGDRWLFNYTSSQNKAEKLTAHFYYDRENQIDEEGTSIASDNKIIIDVEFKTSDTNNTLNNSNDDVLSIGNLAKLRTIYEPDYKNSSIENGERRVSVLIQFRYAKYNNESKTVEETYVGSWHPNGIKRIYYMSFSQES